MKSFLYQVAACLFLASVLGAAPVLGGGVVTGDVDGNSKITMAEVLYGLRTLSNLTYQAADFGDLPDDAFSHYPTLRNTTNALPGRTGPYHRDVSHEWIGSSAASTTDTEYDALIPDQDNDDAVLGMTAITSGPPGGGGILIRKDGATGVGMITVPIGTDGDPAMRYLNVAADFNNDGMFASYGAGPTRQHEWIVVNLPVQFSGKAREVSTSFSLTDAAALASFPCIRITLTTEIIDPALFGTSGWDGSGPAGGFARGETEDWCPSSPGAPTNLAYDWPEYYGAVPPTYEIEPPTNPQPPPGAPQYDPPENANPPGLNPPGAKKDIGTETFPVTEAPGGMVNPPAQGQQVFKKRAYIEGMYGAKQSGEYDCMPTCAANSVGYLLDRAGVLTDMQESGCTGTPFAGIPSWPNDASGFIFSELKSIMENGGMMDVPDGKGTTTGGFMNGKKAASNALKNATGKGLTTKTRANPSFNNICEAVSKGRDVEILMEFKPSDPPDGHMVIVTGATMDQNGNLTLTFVDPGNPQAGEQTYTVANGAAQGSDAADNGGGLEVKNYPGAKGKRAVITHVFEEYLTDTQ